MSQISKKNQTWQIKKKKSYDCLGIHLDFNYKYVKIRKT